MGFLESRPQQVQQVNFVDFEELIRQQQLQCNG